MKKYYYLFLGFFLALISTTTAFAEILTGNCGNSGNNGDNVTYSLDTETGVLTISGTGEMRNYEPDDTREWRTMTKKVIIKYGVESIGQLAFNDCSNLTSVSIPNSVTTIGNEAFGNCEHLTEILLPNSIKTIEPWAFWTCPALTSIIIPNSVRTIGDHAFCRCSNLIDVVLSNSITTIGEAAFQLCSSLTKITIPKSVSKIERWAFSGCSNLTSIEVDSQNAYYVSDNGVLYDKEKTMLIQVPEKKTGAFFIPNTVLTIGDEALTNCTLSSIVIPYSVKDFEGGYAFYGCNCLTSITCLGTNPPIISSNWAFFGCPDNITLHVKKGCKETYSTADSWKELTILDDVVTIEFIDADSKETEIPLMYDDEENNTLTLPDTYQSLTVPQDIPLKQISYERNFGNTSWQSLYVPFEIPVTAELLEEFELAYINAARQYDYDDDGSIDDLTIEIFKVKSGTLRANHPYLIRAKETGMKTITVDEATLYATAANQVDCSTTSLSFTFKGAYETLTYDDIYDCRLLGSGKWNTPTTSTTMKPMRFYLRIASRGSEQLLPASSSATPIRMTIWGEDGEATEVDDLQMSDSESPNRRIFDLQGRPVEQPESGMYIINGKKVIIK